MYCFLLAFASLNLTSFGYVFVIPVESRSHESYYYDGYRVKAAMNEDRAQVLIADRPASTSGELSILSVDNGSMLLNGRLVRMTFPPDGRTTKNSDFRLHVPEQNTLEAEMFTSGYELGMRENTFDRSVSRLVTARPILYYSQNVHQLCPTRSDASQEDSIQVLLLFPYIFNRDGCHLVRLMQTTDPSNSDLGFTPANRRGWPIAKPNQSPTLKTTSEVWFCVRCPAWETCVHDGKIVQVSENGGLRIGPDAPSPRHRFQASITNGKLVPSGSPDKVVSVYLTNYRNYVQLADNQHLGSYEMVSKIYKVLDGFQIEKNGRDKRTFLAISGQSVWQECSMDIVHIAGGSDLECSDIRIEVIRTSTDGRVTLYETKPTYVAHHDEISNEIQNENFAEQTLSSVIDRSDTTDLEGDLYIRCMMPASAVMFPCDSENVVVPPPSENSTLQFNYLSVNPLESRHDRRVRVMVFNGIPKFAIYGDRHRVQDLDLFFDRGFLSLGNSAESATAQFPGCSLYILKDNHLHYLHIRSNDRIMQINSRSIFYLCREVTRDTVMYFILPQPRRSSSFCTFVVLFIRPNIDPEHSDSDFPYSYSNLHDGNPGDTSTARSVSSFDHFQDTWPATSNPDTDST